MRLIRHVVLINWQEGASTADIENWIELCNRIPDECPMVCNWCSSYSISLAEPANVSSHAFCIQFDFISKEEWIQYLKHTFPSRVYSEGMKVIDMARTASANMLVEAKAEHTVSSIRDRQV
jgi:hypothetical protein